MNDRTNPHLNDAALERLAHEVDLLAAADGAREGLEARVFAATLPLLQPQPALRLVGGGVATRRRALWTLTPVRIAAGFALIATAALTYMAGRPAPLSPGEAVRVVAAPAGEEWAIVSSIFDDGTRAELDDIFAAATSLESSIQSTGWNDYFEEGAM